MPANGPSMMLRAAIDRQTFEQARAAAAFYGKSTPEWLALVIEQAVNEAMSAIHEHVRGEASK